MKSILEMKPKILKVSYQDFDPSRILFSSAEIRDIPGGPQKYGSINLQYNYGTDEEPRVNSLLLEAPALKSMYGIKENVMTRTNGDPTTNYSISFNFDSFDPDVKMFLNKFRELYLQCVRCIQENKGVLRLFDFDATKPGSMFKYPIIFQRDRTTGEIIPGRDPYMYVKLVLGRAKSLFLDADKKILDWDLFYNTEITCLPLICIERIYVQLSKSASLQIKLASASILSAVPSGWVGVQDDSIDAYQAIHPEWRDSLNEQLSVLRSSRSASLESRMPPSRDSGFLGMERKDGDPFDQFVSAGYSLPTLSSIPAPPSLPF